MIFLGQIELGLSDCANSEFHARTLYSAYYNVDCVKAACMNPTCTIFYLIATMEGNIFLGNVILSYFLVNMSSFLCNFYVILSLIGAHVVSMNCCSL